jgi:DNA-binding winged helix-turn-helix (wHTH) protein
MRMTYRFDPFTLDTGTRQLLRDGEEIHISPKAFDLLRCLIENRSRAMSHDELQSIVWPSTFVLETNLASLVAEIRRVLGDRADDPIFVRTMHRFGYWFIGAVHDSDTKDEPMTPAVKYWLIWDTRQVALGEGENVVGRAPDAAVWIDASGVSRHHARIVVARGAATVEDLGSKNGTYVGAQRVTGPRVLADGEQIRLGSVVITFRIPQAPGTTEAQPAQ